MKIRRTARNLSANDYSHGDELVRTSIVLAALGLASALVAAPSHAQNLPTGYDGWFATGELGGAILASDYGYWWGPGGPPNDPRVTFRLNDALGVIGAGGVGYDWGNGIRVDGTLGVLGAMQVDGVFDSASDGTLGHATDIHAPVSAFTSFANFYIEPLRLAGYETPFQPFLTGGIGVAVVSVGEWTRYHSPQPVRSWSGNSQLNVAWQAGGGVSIPLENLTGGMGHLDFTYRYTDLGQASGGTSAVNPPPSSPPTEPFNFRLATHTATIGIRFPLGN